MKIGAAGCGSGVGGDRGDALNFDVVFSDDAGRQRFRGERAGGSCGALDVEKRDAVSVRRECGRVDVAVELREAKGGIAVEMREIEIGLAAGSAQSERKASDAESGDQARSEALQEWPGAAAVTGSAWARLSKGAKRIWPASSHAMRLPSGETATWAMVRARFSLEKISSSWIRDGATLGGAGAAD